MAKHDEQNELSMENYFNERLADDTEPNNPFAVVEAEPQPSGKRRAKGGTKKKKRQLQRKRILTLLCVLLVLILALVIFILVQKRRNDGARYARLLSENIGSSMSTAKKAVTLDMKDKSAYPTLNQLFASYQAISESRKSCRIQGVKLPEWAIFCNTDAEELTVVTYYNYDILEKNVFGTERKAYLDPNLIEAGATLAQVEDQLGLKPYRIQYLQGKIELREYRYCYNDAETGDVVSYVITAVWDKDGKLQNIADIRRNYIGSLLASPQ